jgi:DNA-binding transcriptional ArsR family regulator
MSDVTGSVTDPDLSVAYRALERRREEVIVQRDRIAAELKKLDAALEALRALAKNAPEAAAANGQEAAFPASAATEVTKARAEAAPELAAEATKAADRRVRIIEFLLENPRQWFTSSEIALLTEEGNVSGTQRNAVSEALRRLLRRKAVHRDEKSRPVRYRAVPSVLRELLLTVQ